MKELYNNVLDEVSRDPRLDTGIFNVLNNTHLEIFREYLSRANVSEATIISASNKLAESGKHPERQAFNLNGLLVTFPTPEYKQRAIQRGTHFEKNPKLADVNIFDAPAAGAAPTTNATPPATPVPASTTPAPIPAATNAPVPPAPVPATPPPQPDSVFAPANNAPISGSLPVSGSSPVSGSMPVDDIDVDSRTPVEKKADAVIVSKMLANEYTITEALNFGFYKVKDKWFSSEGILVGTECYVDDAGKILITSW